MITRIKSDRILGENGLPSKYTYSDSDGDEYAEYYLFDSKGRLIKESDQKINGSIDNADYYTEYTYDQNGNLKQIKHENGDYWYKYDYTYHSNGKLAQ